VVPKLPEDQSVEHLRSYRVVGGGQGGVGLVNPNARDADQASIQALQIGIGCLSEGRRGGWGGIPASRPSVPMQTNFRTY
jgi:hypothetical protein